MQTAWLKYYYPHEFMTALISSYILKNDEKITQYIHEAKRLGIKILPPDINMSRFEFSLEGDAIRFGLGAIKGLSKTGVAIIREREAGGPFLSFEDFIERLDKKTVNIKAIDTLVLAGTFDSMKPDGSREDAFKELYALRKTKFNIEDIIEKYLPEKEDRPKQMYKVEDSSLHKMDLLSIERSLLGLYLSYHPLEGKGEPIDWDRVGNGDQLDITGIIKKIKVINTKKGEPMAFVLFETMEGDKDITVFPSLYSSVKNKLDVGGIRVITVTAKSSYKDPSEIDLLAKNIKYYRGDTVNDNNKSKDLEQCFGSVEEEIFSAR